MSVLFSAGFLFCVKKVVLLLLTYSFSSDAQLRNIFAENFATSVSRIHNLELVGREGRTITFTYDGELTVKHPEDYKDIPCDTDELTLAPDNFFIEKEMQPGTCIRQLHKPSPQSNYEFCESSQQTEKLKILLPFFQCKKGKATMVWQEYKDTGSGYLIYNPHTHQAYFAIH